MGAIVYRTFARKLSKIREAIEEVLKRRGFEWLSHSSNRKLETGKDAAAKAGVVLPMAIAGRAAGANAAMNVVAAASEAGLKARLKSTWKS
jgi:hypothetical protein